MTIQVLTDAQLVAIVPRQIWCERTLLGDAVVKAQDQGAEASIVAVAVYAYPYTDNGSVIALAQKIAQCLGAHEPIEWRDEAKKT